MTGHLLTAHEGGSVSWWCNGQGVGLANADQVAVSFYKLFVLVIRLVDECRLGSRGGLPMPTLKTRQPTSKAQPCVCVQLRVAVSSSDSGSIHIPPKRSASRFLFFFSGITVLLTLTTCNSATDPPRPKVTIEQNAARAQSASAETANHGLAFESLSQNICL